MPGHSARKHAKFAASSAHMWTLCTAQPSFVENLPDTTSKAAEEGTECHEWLEKVLLSETCAKSVPDDSMRAAILLFMDEIQQQIEEGWTLYSEQQGFIEEDCGGTVDACLLSPDETEVHILDLKYGFRYVEVQDNPQLLTYAAVASLWFRKATRFTVKIVQPRSPFGAPVRSWSFDYERLAAFMRMADEARYNAEKNPKFFAGDHCYYCKGAAVCEALQQKALSAAFSDFEGVKVADLSTARLAPPDTIPNDRLAHVLAGRDLLRDWLKACERVAEAKIRAGERVPGFKLVEAQARRGWRKDLDAGRIANALSMACGHMPSEFLRDEPVGITEAETKVKSRVRENCRANGLKKPETDALVRGTIERLTLDLMDKGSSGNLTLVADSDPRPAVSITRDAFAGVTLEHEPEAHAAIENIDDYI